MRLDVKVRRCSLLELLRISTGRLQERWIWRQNCPKRGTPKRNLELSEMVVVGNMAPNTANSVYKIQRQLFARSERVKGIDFHPVEPWILTTLYSGTSGRMEYEECG